MAKKKQRQMESAKTPSLKTLEKKFKKRGFKCRRIYAYDSMVIYFDLGNLLVYVPSDVEISCSRSTFSVMQIDPAELTEKDERFFEQGDRILTRNPIAGDVCILHKHYVYAVGRRRKWKKIKAHKLGLRVAVDLPLFVSEPGFYKKSRISEVHLQCLLGIPVPQTLKRRKQQYENYIDGVLTEMHKISQTLQLEIDEIEELRLEAREHLKLVSVDIEIAHAVAMCEKRIRKCTVDQQQAKNLLKEAVANMAAFSLEAESAAHTLASCSTDVARASATLTELQ